MPMQIRPNRIELNDRFPMLAFSLQSSEGQRCAEVVLVTQLALLADRSARTSGNFYSSREHGMLTVSASGAVYTVPPQVLARFIGAEKLYVGLASGSAPGSADWRLDVTPSETSAYVSLRGLTDRALRRVRMFPAQTRTRSGPAPAVLTWTGDTLAAVAPAAAPTAVPTAGTVPSATAPAAPVPYNDGFGPLPPLQTAAADPAPTAPATAPAPAPDATAANIPVAGQALAMAMAAGDVTVGSERQAVSLPSAEPMGQLRSTAIQALLMATNPVLAPAILGLRIAVEASGLTIGVGPSVSAGLLAGGALGCGLIFAPGNVMGIYGSGEIDAGWIASIGAQLQLTVVRGGIAAFNGVGYCAGVSAGEGIGGGAAALFDANRDFCGVTLSVGVSADLSPVQIYTGVQHSVATSLALTLGEDDEPSIEGPVVDEPPSAAAAGLGNTSPLTTADYPGARLMPSPAFSSRRGTAIDRIVIHITSAPQSPYIGSHFARPDANSSAHYMVDQNGAIIQFVREVDKAWHAGTANRRSIGIEHVAVERGGARYGSTTFPYTPPTDAELTASAQLVAHLCSKYSLTPDRSTILGHHEADPSTTHSSCPDGAWDWDDYMVRVAAACAALPAAATAAPAATAQAFTTGTSLVFSDVPGDWHTVDFSHVKLTAIAWDTAPANPVAFAFFGHPNIDFDGSPTAYHPADTGDDTLSNAGNAAQGWFGVVAKASSDPDVLSGHAQIDQRPERLLKGKYPVIQQASNNDPAPGYYVSQTARSAQPNLPSYAQNRYFDASTVPFGALSGKLRDQGLALGDFGLAIRHDQALQSGFYFVDAGGKRSFALGEGSQKVGTNLGGSGRGNRFNNNFPVSYLVFPHSAQGDLAVHDDATISQNISGILASLSTASNARELALLLAHNEVSPGRTPAGAAGLEAFRRSPPANLPTNFATVCQGLRQYGFAISEAAVAQGLAAHALSAQSWTINWDDVEKIPQPTDNGCWATAAAMVLGWRDRVSISPALLAHCNAMDTSLQGGLLPSAKRAFIDAVGLVVHPNACYTAEAFRDIIEANGPIWVTADVPGIHAIVVTGMYSDGGQSYVRITDPWDRVVGSPGSPGSYATSHATGSQYIMTYDAFTAEFEAAGNIDRIQLAHSGGTFGHTINRGNASAAGYAQGLGELAIVPPSIPAPTVLAEGTNTRTTSSEGGRSYDLAQLSGMVRPSNALAGGAGMPPVAGERVVLDDWPYIEEEGQRSQANLTIDWKFDGAAVGEVVIAPSGGSVASGRSVAVTADILPGASTPDKTVMLVRVTTKFTKAGEADQSAVNEVTLAADGRANRTHCAPGDAVPAKPDGAAVGTEPPAPLPEPTPQPQPVMA